MDEKKISQFEQLLNNAKDSKHTDAVLLLAEKKPEIQSKFASIIAWIRETSEIKEWRDHVEETVSLVAEWIFNECVNTLICDKK